MCGYCRPLLLVVVPCDAGSCDIALLALVIQCVIVTVRARMCVNVWWWWLLLLLLFVLAGRAVALPLKKSNGWRMHATCDQVSGYFLWNRYFHDLIMMTHRTLLTGAAGRRILRSNTLRRNSSHIVSV